MKENEVAALVRGLAPGIRQVVTEATVPLISRLAELEARPIEKGDPGERGADGSAGPKGDSGELAPLPPELAEQVASAVRMLHESPDFQRSEAPRPSKVTRIERDADGNFVPVYENL